MNNPTNSAADGRDDGAVDLSRYWSTIWRYKWKIFAFVLVVSAATFFYVSSLDKLYRATSTMLIESEQAKVVSIEDVYSLNNTNKEYYQTQFEVLKSRELATRVVKKLDLIGHPLFDPRQQKEGFNWKALLGQEDQPIALSAAKIHNDVVAQLQKGLSISPIRNTQLVKISYESNDPELAAQIANTLASEYIQSHIESQMSVTMTAADGLTERLEGLKTKLQDSERRLQEYREAEGLVDVQGVQTLGADELTELTQRFVAAANARSEEEVLYQQVRQLGESPPVDKLMTIQHIALNPLVQSLRQDQVSAERKVAELAKRYGPKHPKMIAALSDAQQALSSLEYQVRRVSSGIKTKYQGALKTEQSLKRQIDDAKQRFQGMNRKEFKLRELERDVDANRQLYDMFLTRAKEATEAEGLQTPHARIIDVAVAPDIPVKPNKKLLLILAGLVSAVVGVMLAFAMELMNNTLSRPDEVEEKLGAPLLGFLPLEVKNKSKLPYEGFSLEAKGAFSEAVRTIRTALVLSGIDKSRKITVVTSSVPGEGKSTVALNLARALGQLEKVLLIDADMRRPSLTRVSDLPRNAVGLSNWVVGSAKVSEIIYRMDEWSIDIMPSGLIPHNPLELLSSKRFEAALEKLKSHYDRIIIDSAPVFAVSDALVLASHADTVIYTVRAHSTATHLAAKGISKFREINIPLFTVLNQVDVRKSGRYEFQYYRNYGYSSEAEFYAQKKYQQVRPGEVDYKPRRVSGIEDI